MFQIFRQHAGEKDLLTDALVAGLTSISLHTELTSFITFLSRVETFMLTTTRQI